MFPALIKHLSKHEYAQKNTFNLNEMHSATGKRESSIWKNNDGCQTMYVYSISYS